MFVLSRVEAKRLGKSRYYTGKLCKHGHISERMTCDRACIICQKKAKLKNYAKSEKAKSSQSLRSRRWYLKNKEKADKTSRKWAVEHPEAANARFAKRRAAVRNQMPKWANVQGIKEIYRQARILTERTGIKHHVDHIIPLQSDIVSGLHVEENLQILEGRANQSKGNRLIAA